jgi:hypothetical protein
MTDNFAKDEHRPSQLLPVAQLLDFHPSLHGLNVPLKILSHMKWLIPEFESFADDKTREAARKSLSGYYCNAHSCLRNDLAQIQFVKYRCLFI